MASLVVAVGCVGPGSFATTPSTGTLTGATGTAIAPVPTVLPPPPSEISPAATSTASASQPPLQLPQLELVVLTRSGRIQRFDQKGPLGRPIQACRGQGVAIQPAPVGRTVAVACSLPGPSGELVILNTDDGAHIRTIEMAARSDTFAWAPDATSIAVLRAADSSDPGIWLIDVASGRTARLLDRSALLSDVRWTSIGLSHFAIAPPQQGSWAWDGAAWRRISSKTLIAAGAEGVVLLEAREGMGIGGELWLLAGGIESRLTRQSGSEVALAMLSGSRALAWRGGAPGRFVLYEGASVVEIPSESICTRGDVRDEWFACDIAVDRVQLVSIAAHRTTFLVPGFPADSVASALLPVK